MVVKISRHIQQSNIKRMLACRRANRARRICSGRGNGSRRNRLRRGDVLSGRVRVRQFPGAFAVVTYVAGKGERFTKIDDFQGFARHNPTMAADVD